MTEAEVRAIVREEINLALRRLSSDLSRWRGDYYRNDRDDIKGDVFGSLSGFVLNAMLDEESAL